MLGSAEFRVGVGSGLHARPNISDRLLVGAYTV